MKAMIFAAGIGSRLKELTQDTPKCLIEIAGTPMLERVVTSLKEAGVTAVAINLHHHAEQVVTFVESRNRFGIEVTFSHEPTLLDTGGGLKKIRGFFQGEEAFFIHNADIHCTSDLKRLMSAHRERNAIATLLTMERPDTRGLYFGNDRQLVGWTGEQSSVPSATQLRAFCGISVASSDIFRFMGDEEVFSIIRTFLEAARNTHLVFGQTIDPGAQWVDIGTPEELRALRSKLA
jgi:MurNAc alpha-1-phosphate uridylyltransferase